jgi:hypothetical protein
MDELDWLEDTAELERDRAELSRLEMILAPGKTVTYEGSEAVNVITRKLLERSWQEFPGGDRNREAVEALLKRSQQLRRSISRVVPAKYDQEYESWIESWKSS